MKLDVAPCRGYSFGVGDKERIRRSEAPMKRQKTIKLFWSCFHVGASSRKRRLVSFRFVSFRLVLFVYYYLL